MELLFSQNSFAQGSLTPPGPPAPTMKTLDQVEARTPIDATHTPGNDQFDFVITQPGSYYLTGNLTPTKRKAIDIEAAGVTVDLNGFEIRRPSGGDEGISVASSADRCTIKDGSISGFITGVDSKFNIDSKQARGGAVLNIRVTGAPTFAGNGVGISTGESWIVSGCSVHDHTGTGIVPGTGSTVIKCTVTKNGNRGIAGNEHNTISDCTADENVSSGIQAGLGSTISNCTADNNTGDGIQVDSGSTVRNCTAKGNGGDGIQLASACLVRDNNCRLNTAAGVHALGNDIRVEANNVIENMRGIHADAAGNLIIKNSASGNTTNYDIVANNKVGPIVASPNSMAISGDTGGAGVGSTDPWANFTY